MLAPARMFGLISGETLPASRRRYKSHGCPLIERAKEIRVHL